MRWFLSAFMRLIRRPFSLRRVGTDASRLTNIYMSEVQQPRGTLAGKYRGNRERV